MPTSLLIALDLVVLDQFREADRSQASLISLDLALDRGGLEQSDVTLFMAGTIE